MDRSLQCRLIMNIEAVEATVLVSTAAFYRCHRRAMWLRGRQNSLISASSTCRPLGPTRGAAHRVPPAQPRHSPCLAGPPTVGWHQPPAWQLHPFCRVSHPALQAPLQGHQPHVACVLLSPQEKANTSHWLAFSRSSLCSVPPLINSSQG